MTYGITTEVKPLTLSKKQVTKYLDKIERSWNNSISNIIKEQETITTICNLLQLLDIDKVLVTESGTKLDCHLKIDVAVKKGDRYIGFQVKSNEYNYNKYCNNYLNQNLSYGDYNGVAPGCVWLNRCTNRLRFLIAISKWLGISISEPTKDAIRKYKQCKEKGIKGDLIVHLVSTSDINIWITLGIAKCDNGAITYLH